MLDVALEQDEKNWLVRWWCDKYRRPRKDPLLLEYTTEELYVEYLEDRVAAEGGAAAVRERMAEAVAKDVTAREIASEDPDPFVGISEEERDRIRDMLGASVEKKEEAGEGEAEFFDDYADREGGS